MVFQERMYYSFRMHLKKYCGVFGCHNNLRKLLTLCVWRDILREDILREEGGEEGEEEEEKEEEVQEEEEEEGRN